MLPVAAAEPKDGFTFDCVLYEECKEEIEEEEEQTIVKSCWPWDSYACCLGFLGLGISGRVTNPFPTISSFRCALTVADIGGGCMRYLNIETAQMGQKFEPWSLNWWFSMLSTTLLCVTFKAAVDLINCQGSIDFSGSIKYAESIHWADSID